LVTLDPTEPNHTPVRPARAWRAASRSSGCGSLPTRPSPRRDTTSFTGVFTSPRTPRCPNRTPALLLCAGSHQRRSRPRRFRLWCGASPSRPAFCLRA